MVDAGITTLVISKSASAMFTMNALPAEWDRQIDIGRDMNAGLGISGCVS